MASLQKRNGSYRILFFHQGKLQSFTLGKVIRAEAERKAAQVDYLLMRLKQRLVQMPDGIDIVTFVEQDGSPVTNAGTPISRAAITLAEARDRYIETLSAGAVEANSLATTTMHIGHFVRTFGGQIPFAELTQLSLQRHINERAKKKYRGRRLSPVTLKKEMASLRAMWNWAVNAKLIQGHFPSRGLVYPKHDEKPSFQTRVEIERKIVGLTKAEQSDLWDSLFLTLPEIDDLLAHVQKHGVHAWLYPMFAFAAQTGARRSELLRVRVHDVDLEAGTVLLHEKKRQKGKRTTRRVPLSPKLIEILREWLSEHPGGYLFCHTSEVYRSKKRSRTTGHRNDKVRPSSLKGRMKSVRLRESAALTALTKDEAHDHFQRTLRDSKWSVMRGWHVLRHSFISNAAAAGIDQRLIDAWVGHTTEEMRKRYRHLIPSVEQAAITRLFG